jgi:glycine hydroxymethyltransferase
LLQSRQMSLKQTDPSLCELIRKEQERQRYQLQMIPSENYVSKAVLEAVGSVLMNKYSEGQAFKRYYQGNFIIDEIETLVKERALKAFGLDQKEWGVNVQPACGSIANLAVYAALIKPGDKLMGMFLYDGGHLSHGWQLPDGTKVSFTSQIYKPSYYYVDVNKGHFNYDEIEKIALKEKPQIIISGGTAYPREIDHARMRKIADRVKAYYLADIAHEAGLVLAGVNQSPFPYAHIVTMTTRKTLRGPIGAMIFAQKNLIDSINRAVFPGLQGGPLNHSIAGIGVALHEAMQPEFKKYAAQIIANAKRLAKEMIKRGYYVCSGGTDKHLILIDLRTKGLTGKGSAQALEKANIIVNKNTVPGETGKPWNPSGIRLGTPALTSRGMEEKEMVKISAWTDKVLMNQNDKKLVSKIATEVKKFACQFPVPGVDK